MITQPKSVKFEINPGQEVFIETGKLARQADGAVTVRQGNCILLATVVANKDPKEGQDFFPLSVDYQEKFASAGRIPGSFFKREARLNDYEILTSRLIDRALRPLFPEDYLCDVQVLISLISSDENVMPDSLACLAASAALAVSNIPIKEIISEVRIGRIKGEFIINPSKAQLAISDFEFLIAATEKNLMMVEGEAKECSEEELVQCLEIAHEAIRKQIKAQAELRKVVGITEVRDYKKPEQDIAIKDKVYAFAKAKVTAIAEMGSAKHERSDAFTALKKEIIEHLGTEITDLQKKLAGKYYEDLKWELVRDMMVDKRIRLDGRKLDQVRPLAMEVDPLPTPHGSSLFTRGETQSLTTVTLGTKLDELMQETAASAEYTKFFLHYNFPPFSTGEVKMMRGVGRREVGHGNLAMRSLKRVLPADSTYTIRVVSDILESNGSSSMATVCGTSLALMDAGVPLSAPVAGVAMGLVKEEDGFAVLTDILGDEDHLGDMDFKVAGTDTGVTALQMDIKIQGITEEIMETALEQARDARIHILGEMNKVIGRSRETVSDNAPAMVTIKIDAEKIRDVIGKGGATIRSITEETGASIDIEDDGTIVIFGEGAESRDAAVDRINMITAEAEVGQIYKGKVVKIADFGAFVNIIPGKDGLVHISQIANERVEKVTDYLSEGQEVDVIVLDVDRGRIKLSIKEVPSNEASDESADEGDSNEDDVDGNTAASNEQG